MKSFETEQYDRVVLIYNEFKNVMVQNRVIENFLPVLSTDILEEVSEDEIRKGHAGNLCRCIGYQNILKAVEKSIKS